MAIGTYLKSVLTISLFSLLLLFSTTAQANTNTVAPNSFSIVKDNIEYYVQTDKSVYELHETVDMLYRVANVGDEDVKFSIVRYLNEPTCIFEVIQGSSRIWTNQPSRVVYVSVDASFTLKPNENAEFSEIWNMYDESNSLINTGQYDIVSYLHLPSTDKRYVPVSVSINVIHKPGTHYVKNGESIQTRIDDSNVVDGDIIIVFPGTYFENINFNGKNITLRSTDPNDPNVVAATIIDGGQNGSVVTFNSGEDANCVLNGFNITNGYAEYGGGICCALPPGPPPPPPPPPPTPPPGILSEQSSQEVLSEPVLSGPVIKNCVINNNSADAGGGMYNQGSFLNQLRPVLINCTFNGNSASDFGGGIYNYFSSPVLTDCTFSANSAVVGGGMRNQGNSISQPAPILTNCTFNGNSASDFGGGMENHYTNTTLANCTFNENSADHGGGMRNVNSSPILTDCTFNENSAGDWGGGMSNYISSTILTNCAFSRNSAYSGGGMYNVYGNSILTNCMFNGNSVETSGGGMINDTGSSTLINCTFTGNYALGVGGRPYNASGGIGNILYHTSFGSLTLTNCILWDNMAGDSTDESAQVSPPLIINYSCVQGWTGVLGGTGNIGDDPCFVVPGYFEPNCVIGPYPYCTYDWIDGDYHLLPDSPCINAGDPNYIAEPDVTDLDGNPRLVAGRIDMGAYEAPPPAEVRITPRTINLASKGNSITCYIRLAESYDVADIDPNSVLLQGKIEAESVQIDEVKQIVTAQFGYEQLQEILNVNEIELIIILRLTDGTVFRGTDVISVKGKKGRKPDKYEQAGNPDPPDGAIEVSRTADLSWTPGYNAESHDVYFGTANPPPFIGNQTATTFDPGTMDYETIYYWRIDEINKWGVTTGDIWHFTTIEAPPPPGKPPGSPPGCFPADTPVWIDGAQVQFSKVAAGRKVGRLDPTEAVSCFEKPVCLKEIESVLEYQGTDDYYNIVFENGNRINVVHSHYFLTASDRWVLVENLKIGSKLQSLKGPISIRTIAKREVPFTGRFYNLKIKGGDRYFVGKDGVVVRSN